MEGNGRRPTRISSLLEGRTCVVSGVGPGLGRHTAVALACHGANLVLAARRERTLEEVAAQVEECGSDVVCVPTNIADPDQCARLAEAATEEFGGVDVVVNNAFRMDVFQTFSEVDLTAWRKIADVNVFGTLQVTKALLPALRRREGGSIVMVSSMATRKPHPFEGGYAVSKGALVTAARVLASELGPEGIRVNVVQPGWMWGPSVQLYVAMTAEQRGISRQEVTEEITRAIPLRRIPTDEEVAGAVVFLASDLSSAITGQTIDVNGGEVYA